MTDSASMSPIPRALTVASGAFTAWPHRGDGGEVPQACPEQLPEAGPAPAAMAPPDDQLTLYITVDTEDAYFTQPRLMTGDGIGREHGVFAIADALEERSLKGTFFINVFESERQPPGAVRGVVRDLFARGHEIGLHTHPSPDLEWYRNPLFRKSEREQLDILRRGREMLEGWTGHPVISFRAGGYAINDDTFPALTAAGIQIDSSVFFPSDNNHNRPFTVNSARMVGSLVEVPVTYVIRTDVGGRRVEHRKLDFDWLKTEQLLEALATLHECRGETAMFMMHSFSFIDKASLPPDHPRSSTARFTSAVQFNRFVEVYGPKAGAREAFAQLLDRVEADPTIRVARLCDTYEQLRRQAQGQLPDVVPVVIQR